MAINSKGKGKSGGARILTLNILLDAETMDITLLTIYDKGEISNVNDDYIKFLRTPSSQEGGQGSRKIYDSNKNRTTITDPII